MTSNKRNNNVIIVFDKPYLFIDKNTDEVLFVGMVYEPIENK